MAALARARLSARPRATNSWSRRVFKGSEAFQPRQRCLQLRLPRLGGRQLLALLLDHLGGGAGDEVGVAQLLVEMADVAVEGGDLLLQPGALGGEVDDPGQRQGGGGAA